MMRARNLRHRRAASAPPKPRAGQDKGADTAAMLLAESEQAGEAEHAVRGPPSRAGPTAERARGRANALDRAVRATR